MERVGGWEGCSLAVKRRALECARPRVESQSRHPHPGLPLSVPQFLLMQNRIIIAHRIGLLCGLHEGTRPTKGLEEAPAQGETVATTSW